MITNKIFPRQILVEFDELNFPTNRAFVRITQIEKLLQESGYKLIKSNFQSEFLFYK